MAVQPDPEPLTASVDVACPVQAAWDVVSAVGRTGEWSPECRRVVLLGALRVGTLLVGLNRRRGVWWATVSRVTTCSPPHEIGWVVLTNRAEWRYRLTATPSGTRITSTRRTPRGVGRVARLFTRALLGGQTGHDAELERGMGEGLQRIKAILEASQEQAAPAAPSGAA